MTLQKSEEPGYIAFRDDISGIIYLCDGTHVYMQKTTSGEVQYVDDSGGILSELPASSNLAPVVSQLGQALQTLNSCNADYADKLRNINGLNSDYSQAINILQTKARNLQDEVRLGYEQLLKSMGWSYVEDGYYDDDDEWVDTSGWRPSTDLAQYYQSIIDKSQSLDQVIQALSGRLSVFDASGVSAALDILSQVKDTLNEIQPVVQFVNTAVEGMSTRVESFQDSILNANSQLQTMGEGVTSVQQLVREITTDIDGSKNRLQEVIERYDNDYNQLLGVISNSVNNWVQNVESDLNISVMLAKLHTDAINTLTQLVPFVNQLDGLSEKTNRLLSLMTSVVGSSQSVTEAVMSQTEFKQRLESVHADVKDCKDIITEVLSKYVDVSKTALAIDGVKTAAICANTLNDIAQSGKKVSRL